MAEELKLLLTAEDDMSAAFRSAGEAGAQFGEQVQGAQEGAAGLEAGTGEAVAGLEGLESALAGVGESAAGMSDGLGEAQEGLEELGDSAEDAGDSTDEMGGQAIKAREVMRGFGIAMGIVKTGIDLVQGSAERLGRTELADSFERAQAAGDNLIDTITQMNVAGRDSIGWLTDAAEGAANLANLVSIGAVQFQLWTGAITQEEAALQAATIASGEHADAMSNGLPPLLQSTAAVEGNTGAIDGWLGAMQASTAMQGTMVVAGELVTGSLYNQMDAAGALTAGMQAYSDQLVFNAAAQHLDSEGALALAESMGLIDAKSVAASKQIAALTAEFDANHNGIVEASEGADEYIEKVNRIKEGLDIIPEHVVTDYEFKINVTGSIPNLPSGGTHGGGVAGIPEAQHGANFVVPPGFDDDRFPLMVSSGERVIVIPEGEPGNGTPAPGGGASAPAGGGVSVVVHYAPVLSLGDRVELETKLVPLIGAALEKAGYVRRG